MLISTFLHSLDNQNDESAGNFVRLVRIFRTKNSGEDFDNMICEALDGVDLNNVPRNDFVLYIIENGESAHLGLE